MVYFQEKVISRIPHPLVQNLVHHQWHFRMMSWLRCSASTHTHTFCRSLWEACWRCSCFVLKKYIEYRISIDQSIYVYMWLMNCHMTCLFWCCFQKLWLKKGIWGFKWISAVSRGVVRSSSQTDESQPMCEGVCGWMRTRLGGTVERFWPTSSAFILQYFAYCSATRSPCSKRPMYVYSIQYNFTGMHVNSSFSSMYMTPLRWSVLYYTYYTYSIISILYYNMFRYYSVRCKGRGQF